MAYIAFDLDNTLGYFEHVGALANLWSLDMITNPEQSAKNRTPIISESLKKKLDRVHDTFAALLLNDSHLLHTVLRENLDDMFDPIMDAMDDGAVESVIIYSNSGNYYTLDLAKTLIEGKYETPGLFSLLVDHWNHLRTADRVKNSGGKYVEPLKTMTTLQRLFKVATNDGSPRTIPYTSIMFVDDRDPRHALYEQVPEGLTYIAPTHFVPKITKKLIDHLLLLAIYSMEINNITDNKEYLDSVFCHRRIPVGHGEYVTISGFTDLVDYVWSRLEKCVNSDVKVGNMKDVGMKRSIKKFLKGFR
jgi:hypothetical protein